MPPRAGKLPSLHVHRVTPSTELTSPKDARRALANVPSVSSPQQLKDLSWRHLDAQHLDGSTPATILLGDHHGSRASFTALMDTVAHQNINTGRWPTVTFEVTPAEVAAVLGKRDFIRQVIAQVSDAARSEGRMADVLEVAKALAAFLMHEQPQPLHSRRLIATRPTETPTASAPAPW